MASRAPAGVVLADDHPRHGSLSAYNYYRCRCDRCAAANRDRKRNTYLVGRRERSERVRTFGPDDPHDWRMVRRDVERRTAQGCATQAEREWLWNLQEHEQRRARTAELDRLVAQQRSEMWLDKRGAPFQAGATQLAEQKGRKVVVSLDAGLGPNQDVSLHSFVVGEGVNRHLVEWSDPTGETAIEWAQTS